MAKASWNTVSPASGTGNTTVTTGASAHTGRSSRSSTLTIAASGATSKTVTVTQAAAGNILTKIALATIAKGGATVNAGGTSNTTKLTFAITGTGFTIGTPKISTDGGTNWTNITSGTAISGDPGATAAYQWQIPVTVTANPGVSSRTGTLSVTPNEGTALTITLTQAAGDATLSVSPTTVSVPVAGTGQDFTVTSNTDWSIS